MAGEFCIIGPDVVLGRDVKIYNFVNLYGCCDWRRDAHRRFRRNSEGRARRRALQNLEPHVHLRRRKHRRRGLHRPRRQCSLTTDARAPRARTARHKPKTTGRLRRRPSAAARPSAPTRPFSCGVEIGERAIVGAGAVVTKTSPRARSSPGNPARIIESAEQ